MQDNNQFNNWVDQWDKALKDGIFKDIPKEEIKISNNEPSKESFFGDLNINQNSAPSKEEVEYWNDVNNYSEDVVLNEEKAKIKELAKNTTKSGNSANHVDVNTVGSDSKHHHKKGFATNVSINKLIELKDKLYKLENDCFTKEALGKDYKKVEKEIEKLHSIIDEISDELNQEKLEKDAE
jgi:hypothetical protein